MSFETAKDLLSTFNDWLVDDRGFLFSIVLTAAVFMAANYTVREVHHHYIRMRWSIHARRKDAWDKLRRDLYEQRTKSGRAFMRAERKDQILAMVADVIGDQLEDAEYRGKITTEEKYYIYRRLANICGLTDLVPTNYILLKDRIRDRIEKLKSKASVPTVLEEPIEAPTVVKPRKRSLMSPDFKTAGVKPA